MLQRVCALCILQLNSQFEICLTEFVLLIDMAGAINDPRSISA
jgi:hypothetical protein